MPKIRPVSDLRNSFAEISKLVHEDQEPVFITKKGHGDMVVMSMDQYEALANAHRIDTALYTAEIMQVVLERALKRGRCKAKERPVR